MIPLVEELVLVENSPRDTYGMDVGNKIFNKLKEIIDFPEGVQELTIKISVFEPPVIDIVHILKDSKNKEKINTILRIKGK